MMITRRKFGAIVAASPFISGATWDTDVAVIGAGAAGIAAAQVVHNGGRSVQVLEAAPRLGGRCYTDSAALGSAVDLGAWQLYDAPRNPVAGFAALHSFSMFDVPAREMLMSDGRVLTQGQSREYERAYVGLSEALAEAAEHGDIDEAGRVTVPALEAGGNAWLETAKTRLSEVELGVVFENMSVKDWYERADREPSRVVREGLGTLVARLGSLLPVSVNTRVSDVSAASGGVMHLKTSRGALRARAVISTVSIGVLQSGGLSISPKLDAATEAALNGLTMGSIIKIAVKLNAAAISLPANTLFLPQNSAQFRGQIVLRPAGAPVIVCVAGGPLALALGKQAPHERVAFARRALVEVFGTSIERALGAGVSSNWDQDPNIRGAFAIAKPSQFKSRDALQAPIHERIILAGEVLGERAMQSVHGAYHSGVRAGRRALAMLKRKP